MQSLLDWMGTTLAHYLSKPVAPGNIASATPVAVLQRVLQPADVLLVEGCSRFSTAIKYLSQSTWSHAALFVGPALPEPTGREPRVLLEADVNEGVRVVGLSEYSGFRTRICRPVSISPEERHAVVRYALARLGNRYDLKNIIDLARYLLPTPPVPSRWRRRMIELGSGEPTRAVCSTLIAQAFQSIHYPILPDIDRAPSTNPDCVGCYNEILRIRHHSLFTPSDFDLSPYFEIVKPTLALGFSHRELVWADEMPATLTPGPDTVQPDGRPGLNE